MAWYIFSDAHLGSGTPEEEQMKLGKLRELFTKVKTDGERLIILGDLFDFWFEYRHAVPKEHHEVLFLIRELVRQGIKVEYVSGNHDFWMGDYFEKQLGVNLYRDSLELVYNGAGTNQPVTHRLHLLHGDGLAKADRGYRFLKCVLRNKVSITLYRLLPPDLAIPFAKKVSGTSRSYTARRDPLFAADYRAYAKSKLVNGYDVVIIAHLHIPAFEQFDQGIYINTGDFIRHFTYVKIDDNKIDLLRL